MRQERLTVRAGYNDQEVEAQSRQIMTGSGPAAAASRLGMTARSDHRGPLYPSWHDENMITSDGVVHSTIPEVPTLEELFGDDESAGLYEDASKLPVEFEQRFGADVLAWCRVMSTAGQVALFDEAGLSALLDEGLVGSHT